MKISTYALISTACLALALAGCASETDSGSGGNNNGGGGVNAAGTSGGTTGGTSGTTGGTTGGASGTGAGDTSVAGTTGGASGSGSGAGGGTMAPTLTCATEDVVEGTCKEQGEGVFAIRTELDVWWADDTAPPLVDPGRGTIVVTLMGTVSDVCEDGSGGIAEMRGCGTELPLFKSDANCDAFAIQFPDALWDAPEMPSFVTTPTSTGFEPGDILNFALTIGLLGIDLDDPGGEWPTAMETGTISCPGGTGPDCFPDHDGDGKPGITVEMGRIGEELPPPLCGGFMLPFVIRGAPLDTLGALADDGVKAKFTQIGLRTGMGGGGEIGADCMSGSGDSEAKFVDSRVIGCETTDGMPCTPAQSQFVDESAPFYFILEKDEAPPMKDPRNGNDVLVPMTQGGGPLDQTPSKGPRSALVRLGDVGGGFTCADARAATFPPL